MYVVSARLEFAPFLRARQFFSAWESFFENNWTPLDHNTYNFVTQYNCKMFLPPGTPSPSHRSLNFAKFLSNFVHSSAIQNKFITENSLGFASTPTPHFITFRRSHSPLNKKQNHILSKRNRYLPFPPANAIIASRRQNKWIGRKE